MKPRPVVADGAPVQMEEAATDDTLGTVVDEIFVSTARDIIDKCSLAVKDPMPDALSMIKAVAHEADVSHLALDGKVRVVSVIKRRKPQYSVTIPQGLASLEPRRREGHLIEVLGVLSYLKEMVIPAHGMWMATITKDSVTIAAENPHEEAGFDLPDPEEIAKARVMFADSMNSLIELRKFNSYTV